MLILGYEHLFPDIPTRTDKIYHDVDVEGSKPVKEHFLISSVSEGFSTYSFI